MSVAASLWVVTMAAMQQSEPAPADTPAPAATASVADSREAEISLARYSDCVVRRKDRRERVTRYLRLDSTAPATVELLKELSASDCLLDAMPKSIAPDAMERSGRAGQFGRGMFDTYSMTMPVEAYRNAIYPALYRFSFGKTGPGAIADKPPLSVSSEWDAVPDPLPDGWRVRRAIGDCVARARPVAAHRFVVSVPWSQEETGEIGEIAAALSECLPEGQTVGVTREDLRGMLGEALFKLASAPEASVAILDSEAN